MTGYVMAPTPREAAAHIERWQALTAAGVEGAPLWPVEWQTIHTGDWLPHLQPGTWWASRSNPDMTRHTVRLVPLPSLPPQPETVVVVDANTAHALIGRSIQGLGITSLVIYPSGVEFRQTGLFILARDFGESVTLDPLPAPPATERVRLDQIVGRVLAGETNVVAGFGWRTDNAQLEWWNATMWCLPLPLDADGMVEVIAP